MARPRQLLLIAMVYGLGILIGAESFSSINWQVHTWGLTGILLVALSVHYANEYADHETDALTRRTPFSGGSGALAEIDIPRNAALVGAGMMLGVSIGFVFTAWNLEIMNVPSLGLLMVIAVLGWMYSLPPLSLAWRGWGELDNAFLGGIALPVYGYSVQTGAIDSFILMASLPFGMMVFINLLATTWPDRFADNKVGKYTLATLWNPIKLRKLYFLISSITLVLLIFLPVFPVIVTLSSLTVLPVMIWGALTYTRKHSPLPTVASMLTLLIAQLLAWGGIRFFFPSV